MEISLYNTESRSVEVLKTEQDSAVKMYACGPTVYNFAHIGNLRTYINEDFLRRTIEFNGKKIKHVINITDVGHLVSDEDTGEDKMALGSIREGLSIWQLAEKYTQAFMEDMKSLNNLSPHVWCKATDHINEQIALIVELEKLGYTYQIEDGVYYDTSKFLDYGRLGHQKLEDLLGGARVEVSDGKKHNCDFALWKFSPKNQTRLMEWESPWGVGFPGWHIECSAMARTHLGDFLDIHCGGIDHVKIHHTNEIAQIEPVIKHRWVNHWFHSEFLIEKDAKMSKSSGEFLTLSVLKNRGIDPLEYRFYVLNSHYRSKLNYSFEALSASATGYRNLKMKAMEIFEESNLQLSDNLKLNEIKNEILKFANNDLNAPQLVAYLWSVVREKEISAGIKWAALKLFDDILGIELTRIEEIVIPDDVNAIAKKRFNAKKEKNFALADELRGELAKLGYVMEDKPESYILKKKN